MLGFDHLSLKLSTASEPGKTPVQSSRVGVGGEAPLIFTSDQQTRRSDNCNFLQGSLGRWSAYSFLVFTILYSKGPRSKTTYGIKYVRTN